MSGRSDRTVSWVQRSRWVLGGDAADVCDSGPWDWKRKGRTNAGSPFQRHADHECLYPGDPVECEGRSGGIGSDPLGGLNTIEHELKM